MSGVVQGGEEAFNFATGGVGQPGLIDSVAGDTNVASDWMGENLGANSESIMFRAGEVGSVAFPGGGAASTAPRATRWFTNQLGRTRAGSDEAAQLSDNAASAADEFVDLAAPSRRRHILDGEVRPDGTFGGGHRPGTGFPGKSEFPQGMV